MSAVNDPDWIDAFLTAGPDYPAQPFCVADMQILLCRAGVGAGLPPRQAQDMAGLAARLMSDPHLLAMAVASLRRAHLRVRSEGTADHLVIEDARIAMAGPVIVDALATGASRVVLHGLDWPMLLWPVLAHAQQTYAVFFKIDRVDVSTLLVTHSDRDTMGSFGPVQPVPLELLRRLEALAATA